MVKTKWVSFKTLKQNCQLGEGRNKRIKRCEKVIINIILYSHDNLEEISNIAMTQGHFNISSHFAGETEAGMWKFLKITWHNL